MSTYSSMTRKNRVNCFCCGNANTRHAGGFGLHQGESDFDAVLCEALFLELFEFGQFARVQLRHPHD